MDFEHIFYGLWANLDGLHLEDGDSVRVVVIKSPKDVEKLKEK